MKINHLLIVDDDEGIVDIVKEFLTDQVFKFSLIFDSAYDGEDAVKKIASTKYDLIFLDLNLPIKDGISVSSEIRKQDGINEETPIVVISTFASALVNNLKNTHFLAKPFDDQEIIDTIEKHLN